MIMDHLFHHGYPSFSEQDAHQLVGIETSDGRDCNLWECICHSLYLCNQVVDLRLTLHYLGIPIREKSYMFGDNKTVINSSSKPHSKLHKHHNVLSFHCVHEAIVSKYISFTFLDGKYNPTDVLSKHSCPSTSALLSSMGSTIPLMS